MQVEWKEDLRKEKMGKNGQKGKGGKKNLINGKWKGKAEKAKRERRSL